MPLMLGITADPIAAPVTAPVERVAAVTPRRCCSRRRRPAAGAYLVEPSSYGVARFLADLQKADVPVFRSSVTFSAGRSFAPGTLVVPPSARARMVLEAASKETGLPVYATDASPKVAGFQLKPGTKVGLIRGREQHAGRLDDVAARPARGRLQGRLG